MRFAIIENKKLEPTKGAKGICPNCGSELVARCGNFRIHHWSHKGNRNCDPWFEHETEWHRTWKKNYPKDWQEISLIDKRTGEKHIADVRTTDDLVIEFQHSFISSEERLSREKFYKNMIWVVNGARLKNDFKRFQKGINNFRKTSNKGIYLVSFLDECFPNTWLGSSVPVIFDFRGMEEISDDKDIRNSLFCLIPNKGGRESVVLTMKPDFFIKNTNSSKWVSFMKKVSELQKLYQKQIDIQERQQENIIFQKLNTRAK